MMAPRIVLLSNDDTSLSAMHALLTDQGYRTLRCRPRDVTDAHAVVAHADLVILDLWLAQREDGWAFLKHLWGDRETAHLPALIVTGEPVLLPVHTAALHAKRCPVVRKPFDVQDLLAAVATILGTSRQPDVADEQRRAITV